MTYNRIIEISPYVRKTLSYLAGYHMAANRMHPRLKALELQEPHYYINQTNTLVLSKDMTTSEINQFRQGSNDWWLYGDNLPSEGEEHEEE